MVGVRYGELLFEVLFGEDLFEVDGDCFDGECFDGDLLFEYCEAETVTLLIKPFKRSISLSKLLCVFSLLCINNSIYIY